MGRPDMAPMLFAKSILRLTIRVFNQGNMLRDFTFIDDIVEGVVRVLYKPATLDQGFNFTDPNPATGWAPHRILI